jgi:hypothetical protein
MIISASRRTDIPSYYSEWFFNRIKEGFVLVRNPMNFHQVSKIKLTPDVVDAIVFWTKNPIPMMDRLDELADYTYYFQFSVTPYGKDIEPNLPSKTDVILPTFKRLSKKLGAEKVIWRYDPILLNKKYTFDYHVRAFEKIAKELHGYTEKVIFSFVDIDYRGVKNNMDEMTLLDFPRNAQVDLAKELAGIAQNFELSIETCAESISLEQYGIGRANCVDGKLLSGFLGGNLNVDKDKNQRVECGCVSSIEVGAYNTCKNGCKYCYANHGQKHDRKRNFEKHDPNSPLIVGELGRDDKVTEREVRSFLDPQMSFGDCQLCMNRKKRRR